MDTLDFALYRYFDSGDHLLYVGITGDLAIRDETHIRRADWMRFAARSTIERHATLDEVSEAEEKAIKSEHPLFNVRHNQTMDAVKRLRDYLDTVGMPELMPKRLAIVERQEDVTETMTALEDWRRNDADHLAARDTLVHAAVRLGINKRQIALAMGITRKTVYAILARSEQA